MPTKQQHSTAMKEKEMISFKEKENVTEGSQIWKRTIEEHIYLFNFESLLVGAWRSRWNCGRIDIHSLRFRHLSSLLTSLIYASSEAWYPRLHTMQPSLYNPRCLPWSWEKSLFILTRDNVVYVFLFFQSQSLDDIRNDGCYSLVLSWKCQTSESLFAVFNGDMESGCSGRYLFPNATAEKVYVQAFARKNSSNRLCVWILGRFSYGRWTTKNHKWFNNLKVN